VAALRQNIQFTNVQLLACHNNGGDRNRRGNVEFPTGTLDTIARKTPATVLLVILSGIAANKVMRPHVSYLVEMIGGGAGDWGEAKFVASLLDHPSPSHHAFNVLKTSARQFVKKEWQNIVTIGDALIASPERKLSYQQCCDLFGAKRVELAA